MIIFLQKTTKIVMILDDWVNERRENDLLMMIPHILWLMRPVIIITSYQRAHQRTDHHHHRRRHHLTNIGLTWLLHVSRLHPVFTLTFIVTRIIFSCPNSLFFPSLLLPRFSSCLMIWFFSNDDGPKHETSSGWSCNIMTLIFITLMFGLELGEAVINNYRIKRQ